jgi:SAM-dependent methyltransferase
MNPAACSICQNAAGNRRHTAREMMFGFRDPFTYLECGQCGCLQLLDPPADLAKYYPANYYSFQPHGPIKTFLRRQWAGYTLRGGNPLGWLVNQLNGDNHAMKAVRRARLQPSASILDVGCGDGHLIQDLRHLGFARVAGADPYIAQELHHPGGVTVFKKQLGELSGRFDVIMLHHSYEHMERPGEVMQQLGRLLAPDGLVMICIPVAGSYAWRHYGVNWVNLDAPRHLFLHTPRSIGLLAERAGLRVVETFFEGNEGQFLASEDYQRDLPLCRPRPRGAAVLERFTARRRLRELRAQADELNRKDEGDWACFHLRKAG